MSWSPVESDGTYTSDGQWYSQQRRYYLPRTIRYSGNKTAYLSYITKPEWDALYGSAVKFAQLQLTPWDVYFIGAKTYFTSNEDDVVSGAPLYWKSSKEHLLARLIYLTQDQITFLKAIDLHGSLRSYDEYGNLLGDKENFGPYRIPSYQGDGGGGGGGDSGGDSSNSGGDYYEATPPKPIELVLDKINDQNQVSSKIYRGSLSSLGSMVSQGLCAADPEVVITTAQRGYKVGDRVPLSVFGSESIRLGDSLRGMAAPISTGYIRQYWRDPRQTTFGADSAIPALTGVIPNPFYLKDGTQVIGFQGSFIYFVDRQMQRLSGSDGWNDDHFISVFRQVQTAVTISNKFAAAAKNSEKPIENFGGKNMTEVMTQKFDRFKKGSTIITVFNNSGKLVENLGKGEYRDGKWVGFGTSNAVIKSLVDNNFADILVNGQTLADAIEFAGVSYQDIWNPSYTAPLDAILKLITDRATLKTIQEVLQTTIVNISSAYDFTLYEKFSGGTNDSDFKTLREIGEEFGIEHAGVTAELGTEIATMIEKVELPINTDALESIRGENSTINPVTLAEIRQPLITGEDNGPATMQDVIGMASGYLTEQMTKVNEGISVIYADPTYGQRIKSLLTEISRINAEIILEQKRIADAEKLGEKISTLTVDNLHRQLSSKRGEYKTLINQVSKSSNLKKWVDQVNENYLECCRSLYREVKNWHYCEFGEIGKADAAAKMAFIVDLPNLGADKDGIGTGELLDGIAQQNDTGDRLRATLGRGKTDDSASTNGVDRSPLP
jgi:hypothetical protein